jgi:protein TonB
VQAIVSPGGDVESAQIVSGPAGLLKSSVDAVRRWRFAPYRVNGQPATIRTYIRFEYGRER